MKATDIGRPFRMVVEPNPLNDADKAALEAAEKAGELSGRSTSDYPVSAAVITPDGQLFRPLHFKTRDDAIEFYKGTALTIVLGERLKIS